MTKKSPNTIVMSNGDRLRCTRDVDEYDCTLAKYHKDSRILPPEWRDPPVPAGKFKDINLNFTEMGQFPKGRSDWKAQGYSLIEGPFSVHLDKDGGMEFEAWSRVRCEITNGELLCKRG